MACGSTVRLAALSSVVGYVIVGYSLDFVIGTQTCLSPFSTLYAGYNPFAVSSARGGLQLLDRRYPTAELP
jgi:hypothetical protein